jgi:UDP-N-acetyl-D-glucosamine dehydrogenase
VRDRLQPTTRYADLAPVDAVIVAVPTPLTRNREPDLQPLIAAGTSLAGVLQEGQLVVLESTTYPGTTRERLVPLLEESGLAAERDFFVAFSPERVDPGRTDHTLRSTPKVVGGLSPESRARAMALYGLVCDHVIPLSTPEAAELTKLLENVFRSVNIALVNELAILCDRMGVDVWEVVEAAATKPYGFMSFKPGPGMGGHCLPVDPFYLAWRAREFDQQTEFIELAGEVNQRTTTRARSTAPGSGWWGCPTRPAWATCVSRRGSRSCGCCATRARISRTTTSSSPSSRTSTSPPSRSSGCSTGWTAR